MPVGIGLWTGVPGGPAALVLSGGASQGDFEVGVARFLFDSGYKPGLITSTSVGSVNAVKLVEGGSIDPSGLEQIWLLLKEPSDFYTFNKDFQLNTLQADVQSLGADWWAQIGGWEGFGLGFFAVPIVNLYDLVQLGVQLDHIKSAFERLASANSVYTLQPLRTKLENTAILDTDKVKRSQLKLLMSTVSLESGELRYITNTGAVLQSDAVTPYLEFAGVDPNCQPLVDEVQALLDDLRTGGDLGAPQRQRLRNELVQAQQKLRACNIAHPPQAQPLTGISIVDGVIASAAIPYVFQPVKLGMQNYVDGGIRAEVPINAALANGATEVWAVMTSRNQVGPAFDPLANTPICSFDNANFVSIAFRAATDIMPAQIAEDNLNPPTGWGAAAVTTVHPGAGPDVHNGFTVDPGLIRIRIMHGYMRAGDVNAARWLAQDLRGIGGNYLSLVDEVSNALFTSDIVQLRLEIWKLEHAALGMTLSYDSRGTVLPPRQRGIGANCWDQPSWKQLHGLKQKLEQLVASRRSGWNFADGTVCTVRGYTVNGAVPEQPEPSSSWWLQYEQHQALIYDPNFGGLPTPLRSGPMKTIIPLVPCQSMRPRP
jgi:predicted acylesterase/phospholipase RssA